jgi:RiboL-PSP-HEPN
LASEARKAFDANCRDVQRLLDLSPDHPGLRPSLDVLTKAGIVLLTSFWEAYCEDLAAEALKHLVDNASDASQLPPALLRIVARDLKGQQHELAVWQLADNGWRKVLSDRLTNLQQERNRRLNTPKTAQIDELFLNAVGIDRISTSWKSSSMTNIEAARKLDDYVILRGEIAHRGKSSDRVVKAQLQDYYGHIRFLVGKTGGRANSMAKSSTGTGLW